MDFTTAVRTCFGKYVTFSGRAPRSEFWYFVLFGIIGGIVLGILDGIIFGWATSDFAPLGDLFSLAILLPSISVAVRRLHDTGRTGWWWWLWLIPIIGWIILLIWYASASVAGDNEYGPDPLNPAGAGLAATHASPIPKVARDD